MTRKHYDGDEASTIERFHGAGEAKHRTVASPHRLARMLKFAGEQREKRAKEKAKRKAAKAARRRNR